MTAPFPALVMPPEEENDGVTPLEKICRWIPIVGWGIAIHLAAVRCERRRKFVATQLLLRPDSVWEAWGEDPRYRFVARVICEALQREFLWPNANYLPTDPLRPLYVRYTCQELCFAMIEIEARLGISLKRGTSPFGTIGPPSLISLSAFVDFYAKRCQPDEWEGRNDRVLSYWRGF